MDQQKPTTKLFGKKQFIVFTISMVLANIVTISKMIHDGYLPWVIFTSATFTNILALAILYRAWKKGNSA